MSETIESKIQETEQTMELMANTTAPFLARYYTELLKRSGSHEFAMNMARDFQKAIIFRVFGNQPNQNKEQGED